MLELQKQEVSPEDPRSTSFRGLLERKLVATPGALAEFTAGEISHVIGALKDAAEMNDGIDYMAVFVDGERKLWAIDDDSHVTLLLPCEY